MFSSNQISLEHLAAHYPLLMVGFIALLPKSLPVDMSAPSKSNSFTRLLSKINLPKPRVRQQFYLGTSIDRNQE